MRLPRIPHWPLLLGPAALFALGFVLNAFVMGINGGQMPVLIPGGGCPINPDADFLHSCMTASTHLKILADWIVIKGIGIASPGDFGEWACDAAFWPALTAWVALVVKDRN
jgi:Family of unknown function (DUF5317)